MHLLRSILATALLCSATLSAPAAEALSVQILTHATANPTFITGTHAGLITPGEAVRITYTFDDAATDDDPNAGVGIFTSSLSQFDVEFLGAGLSFFFGNPFSSTGTSDDVPQGLDSVAFASASRLGGDTPSGTTPTSISVALLQEGAPGPPGTLVVNDRPVAAPFTFTSASFTLITDNADFTTVLLDGGSATSVPEPATGALLAASLISAALRFRRR